MIMNKKITGIYIINLIEKKVICSINKLFIYTAAYFLCCMALYSQTPSEPVFSPVLSYKNTLHSSVSDILYFINGDSLHGHFIGGNYRKGLKWKSDAAFSETVFDALKISKIRFGQYEIPQLNNLSSVILTNGDSVTGTIEGFAQGVLSLKTSFGGKLNIKKEMVSAIIPPGGNTEILYIGPTDAAEWKGSSWGNSQTDSTVKDGELLIAPNSSLGRDVSLPEKAKIDFTFEAAGQCQFYFVFYADNLRNRFQNNYSLNIFSGYIYMQKFAANKRSSINLGNAQCPELRKGKGHITLFIDHGKGKIIMMVDGKQVKQWVDSKPNEVGKYIYFVNQSQSVLKIRNIVVAKWNGAFLKDPSDEVNNENMDILQFMNDDFTFGHFKNIKDGYLEFSSDEAEYNVSLKKVKKLSFASSGFHFPRRNSEDVRCVFPDSGRLTFKLEKIDNGIISGRSENYGQISLKINYLKRLDLNIYKDDLFK
jgi:hypothetical protein